MLRPAARVQRLRGNAQGEDELLDAFRAQVRQDSALAHGDDDAGARLVGQDAAAQIRVLERAFAEEGRGHGGDGIGQGLDPERGEDVLGREQLA